MNKKKLTINVLIENDILFSSEYVNNQKLQVIVNKALSDLGVTADDRLLRREDGTPLPDWGLTIEDVGLFDGETLRFFKKSKKPDRDKGFAFKQTLLCWHTNPKYQNLFKVEMDALRNGLGGVFKLNKIILPEEGKSGRITAYGSLKHSGNRKHQIQIIFPTKYPSAAPTVKPVTYKFNSKTEAIEKLQIKGFNTQRQFSDGRMCMIDRSGWSSTEHNVGWVLRRAQRWLTAVHSPQGFKDEEVVQEEPLLVIPQGEVILPSAFPFDEQAFQGSVMLAEFKPNHFYMLSTNTSEHALGTPIQIVAASWLRLNEPKSFRELITSNDRTQMLQMLSDLFDLSPLEKGVVMFLGICIPSDPHPWRFFRVEKRSDTRFDVKFYMGKNIKSDLFLRTAEIFDEQILAQKTVTIIGLGALGSEVAVLLGRNGIGYFNFLDIQKFAIGNTVRHAADLTFLSDLKVNAVKSLIHRINPYATINAFPIDVLDSTGQLEQSIVASDLVLVLTADDMVDYLLNDDFSQRYQKPFVFARVSAGAYSACIQVVDTQSACLRCLSKADLDILPTPKDARHDLKELKEFGSCSEPAIAGSGIDTQAVSTQIARIALQLLLGEKATKYPPLAGKQWYWHGPFGSVDKPPFTWEFHDLPKDMNCAVCTI